MIELLVALVAGLIGGLLSRYIPTLSKRKGKTTPIKLTVPGVHNYVVKHGAVHLYAGPDLHVAKEHRREHPGSVLIADGVNRG